MCILFQRLSGLSASNNRNFARSRNPRVAAVAPSSRSHPRFTNDNDFNSSNDFSRRRRNFDGDRFGGPQPVRSRIGPPFDNSGVFNDHRLDNRMAPMPMRDFSESDFMRREEPDRRFQPRDRPSDMDFSRANSGFRGGYMDVDVPQGDRDYTMPTARHSKFLDLAILYWIN